MELTRPVSPRVSRALLVAACACTFAAPARTLGAQASAQTRTENLAANAAIGAAVGGVRALVSRKPVGKGLVRGALGGTAHGAAKQIAAAGFSGAGALGRMTNVVAVATIRTAGSDTLSFLVPLGPFNIELVPGAGDRVRPRVNVWTSVVAAAALLDTDSHLDSRASFSAGAFVFTRSGDRMPWASGEAGFAHPGVIIINRDVLKFAGARELALAHESVHILQWDAYHATLMRPLERASVARLPGGTWLLRYAEFNVLAPLSILALASRIEDEASRPWEREAYRLTGEELPR